MQNPKYLNLLINAAAALTAVAIVGYVIYSAMYSDAVEPCGSRYPSAVRFPLSTPEGVPLTPAELQARAGVTDFGVIENASVVSAENAPAPEVLEVQLRGVRHGADAAIPRTGIGFHWSPPGMSGARSACVAYSAWVPEGFDFSSGGVLPGVFGGASVAANPVGADTISVRPGWNSTGAPTIGIIAEDSDRGRISGSGSTTMVTPGRWSRIEQEVILNAAGNPDGVARLWIDGALVAENSRLDMRANAATSLQGILFTIGYARLPAQPGLMRVSPVEIAWRK